MLHGVTQFASLLDWPALPDSERFQRLLSIVVCVGLWVLPHLAPVWYRRRRVQVLVVFRCGGGCGCGLAARASHGQAAGPLPPCVPQHQQLASSTGPLASPAAWGALCHCPTPPHRAAPSCRLIFFAFPLLRKPRGAPCACAAARGATAGGEASTAGPCAHASVARRSA